MNDRLVIIPTYNEKENIEPMINKIEEALNKKFSSYEIIYVNDGSTDGSEELLNEIAKKNKSARYFFKYMGIYVFSCAVGTNKLSLYFIDQIKSVKIAQIFTNLDIQR